MTPPRSSGPMLPLAYASSMAWLGAVMPYLALELQRQQVSAWAFTAAMVAVPAARLVVGPLWGLLADVLRDEGRVFQLSSALLLLGTLALASGQRAWLAPAVLLISMGLVGVGPLGDAMALKAFGTRYGTIRSLGTVGFLSMALLAGAGAEHLGLRPAWMGVAMGALLLVAALRLPPAEPTPRTPVMPALAAAARQPGVRWLLLASGLHYCGHSTYDGFWSLHVEALGLGQSWTGGTLALGVVVETAVMLVGHRLIVRHGARPLFLLALALAIPRWWLTGTVTSPIFNVSIQAIHGVTFGLFWISAVALIDDRAPAPIKTSLIALLSAAVGGVGALVGNLVGGWLLPTLGTAGVYRLATVTAVLAVLAGLRIPRVASGGGGRPSAR